MRFLDRLFASGVQLASHQAHLTFSSSRAGRTLSRAGTFLKRRLWIWPIIAVVLLSLVGFFVRRAIETTMKANLTAGLQTLLNVETAMLETWFRVQAANAESAANDRQVRETIYKLLSDAPVDSSTVESTDEALAAARAELRHELAPQMTSHNYVNFFVADKSKRIVADSRAELIGRYEIPEYDAFLTRALEGQSSISPPFPSVVAIKDQHGKMRTGVPVMWVSAPVRDANFQVVAALAFQIRPEHKFSEILQLGRIGESGETFAFDKAGLLVSNSRFDHELILLGLLPDQDDSHSIVSLHLRDPQGDMTAGFRPKVRRSELPLTRMAADATAGKSGIDVEGYRDYRGVPVVGAWTWLPQYNMGLATEIDRAEAFRPLSILQWTFWGLLALLGVSSLAIFIFTLVVARLHREAQKAAVAARQLGQYRLEEKLGSGAMGVVYKGHHAMLRRPTAIKMLDLEKIDDESIARFEHEVQITCRLTHPNTIAIYDYGRTPEGVFYYAMEYLDGIDLQALVDQYGPQPEGRVVRVLMQVAGSLYEAHTQGLVHRDIKPSNIMLNHRGGEPDVVKVLDFGLVKAIGGKAEGTGEAGAALTGTPLYMSPEAIQTPLAVDHRSDLYAVGAVGYFLLTGQPVFQAQSIGELLRQHVDAAPEMPSKRLGKPVSSEVENAILACLDKSRAKRPQTARDLAQLLARSPAANQWTLTDAEAWWTRHERKRQGLAVETEGSTTGRYEQTMVMQPGPPNG